jgi:uncharacterized protein YjiS (DUF1127 family)
MNMSAAKHQSNAGPARPAWEAIAKAWARLKDAWHRTHAESELQALDDALLRDIGVSRGVIPYLGRLGRQRLSPQHLPG